MFINIFNIIFDFRKGLFFVRLKDNLNDIDCLSDIYNTISNIGLKYIVLNLNEIRCITSNSVNYILNYNDKILSSNGKLILCEEDNLISTYLFKNKIPYVKNEIQAFDLI